MRMGTVIGRVTLSVRSPRYVGERLVLTLPWNRETFSGEEQFDPAIVVYDQLGANVGQHIAISEGREAACPFPKPTPVDAYCAALIDEFFYKSDL
jgi:carbon dioxide concentrating mechanism protein CcmL